MKGWKDVDGWATQDIRFFFLTYFKVFAILLTYLIKDGSNIFFLS